MGIKRNIKHLFNAPQEDLPWEGLEYNGIILHEPTGMII
jgi:hypothetical protein